MTADDEPKRTLVHIDMRGAIVASAEDAQRWVAEAWTRAAKRRREGDL